jgi:hypothetical protein
VHKKILILLILLIPVAATAQKAKPKNDSNYDERLLHFGFSMGLNTMDFNVKMDPSDPNNYTAEVVSLKPGINIQIVMDYRPATYFDVRFLPGVSFGQRNLNFYDEDGVLVNDEQLIESSFLEFPLLIKAKGMRLNNSRPYLIGGMNFRYDLAAKKEYDDQSAVHMRLRKADLYYEVGAGIDFYLPYFKLTIEAKMSNGLRDVLAHDTPDDPDAPYPSNPLYMNAVQSLKSQIWVLSFHFE